MPSYTAPVKDMQFILHDLLDVSAQDIPGFSDLDRDFTSAVLEEAGKIATQVLAPLNAVGDREGCRLEMVWCGRQQASRKPTNRSAKAAGRGWIVILNTVDRGSLTSCIRPWASSSALPTWRFRSITG